MDGCDSRYFDTANWPLGIEKIVETTISEYLPGHDVPSTRLEVYYGITR